MNSAVEKVVVALEGLASAVVNAFGSDATMTEQFGWNCPALTRHDFGAYPELIAKQLREANTDDITAELELVISNIPKKIAAIQAHILPQMYSSNCSPATVAYMSSLNGISKLLEPLVTWQVFNDPKSMPAPIARRLKALKIQADEIDIDKTELNTKLKLINDTFEAAESLPVNLDELKQAQLKLNKSNEDAALSLGKITDRQTESDIELSKIKVSGEEATRLVALCEKAYQITTTKGLAAAFDSRAKSLSASMIFWVVGLILALFVGSKIASSILASIVNTLSVPNPNWGAILIDVIICILSVGAPVWFSWIATKQIGQRFRLAEDYAYKASVAKAYEGYRKEAVRIDPAFEARLFSSALTRLEEAPLRLVEKETHGSPWHELISSGVFKEAVEKVPNLRELLVDKITSINPKLNAETVVEAKAPEAK